MQGYYNLDLSLTVMALLASPQEKKEYILGFLKLKGYAAIAIYIMSNPIFFKLEILSKYHI